MPLLFLYHTPTFLIPYPYFSYTIPLLFLYHTPTFILTAGRDKWYGVTRTCKGGGLVGILANVMKKNAVILQKPSGMIAVRVDMSSVQRKYYDAMLCVAKKDLKKDPSKKIFTIHFIELQSMLNREERNKNYNYYKERLLELKRKEVEYNILNKDKGTRLRGWFSLVSHLRIEESEDGNRILNVSFEFPEIVREAIIDPNGIYANINLVVVAGLRSRYAIILYELIKDYEKVEIPEMTIKDFRKLFNIENKYKSRIDNLKTKVLDVAVKELNESENVDFFVSYELKKTGKAYTHIKFYVKPKPKVLKLKQQAIKVIEQNVKENPDLQELLALIPSEYRRIAKLITAIESALKEKGKEYVKAQIEYTLQKHEKGKVKDFVVYLKKAIKEDYANFEKVDDIGFITVDDAIGFRGYLTKDGKEHYIEIAVVEPKENNSDELIGRDRERKYLVRLDEVETGEVFDWYEMSEKKLLEYAKKNVERRKKIRE